MSPMNDEHQARWQRAVRQDKLVASGALAAKIDGRQVALFQAGDGTVHACNNRCPHEGYPLCEGHVADDGVLTCRWHNWKFDLRTGANLYGGDGLRLYPAEVRDDGHVWVDTADEPAAKRQARALSALVEAGEDEDRARIARELARLERDGGSLKQAIAHVVDAGHARLRYGMTHAHAAAECWLRLRAECDDPVQRLACGSEALGYLGREVMREPLRPYAEGEAAWSEAGFLAAIEAQDEAAAVTRLHGALRTGLGLQALLPTLVQAALAHYNDFGHTLIYVSHLPGLVRQLGADALRPLLRAWVRSAVYATREDLLPDFKSYAPALDAWPAGPGARDIGGGHVASAQPLDPAAFEALSVRDTLSAVIRAAATHRHAVLHESLLAAGAHHLLRYDSAVGERVDNAVADNVGWLDFSHAITFAHALRQLLPQHSPLWREGLLQMAMFMGRNTPYLQTGISTPQALQRWQVDDAAAFDARCRAQVLDHGLGLDIFPVHWLKTWMAVRGEVGAGIAPATAASLRAALNRLFAARFKQRHAMRMAHQALAIVSREAG